ncbi:probable phosphoglycerate mutase [Nakamurella panacisegetis]|uniref:Probable phosphoglycerate mutase n=1 Tax=Nakamurella panacisegetis TaxID=1090615 RepID=A0A1H0S1Y4_9ACTN|nr:MSMEG_4193 family putative phosphomutase [Nakamurella panacisegetis]SDP35637.1 probable phosphoglycerate mutase [Nakamurella panacisegetis]
MSTVILLRHGRSTANVAGVLAGRTPGVLLDDVGREQAAAVAERLRGLTLDALVSSPMDRCRQTLEPLAALTGLEVRIEARLAEVDYGDWTGRTLGDLSGEELWRTVQTHPSAAVFPGGEGLAAVGVRAVAAIRELVAELGPDAVILVCSHGDVIKAVLADALGLHLDGFQRIVVAPASLSVVRYTPLRPFVERVNDSGELGSLRPAPKPEGVPAAAGGAVNGSGGRHHFDDNSSSDAIPGGVAG